MAERRMFAKSIITSDAFLDLPPTTRCLYFSLGMFADDDGFCNNPKSIMRQVGSTVDDMNLLIAKKFLLVFDNGVIVIKHWRIHNYIRSDRYHETNYKDEKAQLTLDENGAYRKTEDCKMIESGIPVGIPTVSEVDTEVRDRVGKSKDKDKYGEFQNVLLKESEYKKLKERFPKDYGERIDNLSIYMKAKGKQYKDHYATILSWARKEEKEKASQPKPIEPKKYKVFEKEDYEKDDFKAEQMPQELRDRLGNMFNS